MRENLRDDFSADAKQKLAARVGHKCSNPECRQPTSGPSEATKAATNIGVAAHITAASPGGPRFDASLSPQEREALENGIWLCQKCAKAVDDDPVTYSPDLLRQWKSEAEAAARQEIERGSAGQAAPAKPSLIVSSHRGYFYGDATEYFFIRIVNLTQDADVVVTHVWYQNAARVDVLTCRLPVRLKPSEPWDTWVRADEIPNDNSVFAHFHVLLSTGEVFASEENTDVPPRGFVVGDGA